MEEYISPSGKQKITVDRRNGCAVVKQYAKTSVNTWYYSGHIMIDDTLTKYIPFPITGKEVKVKKSGRV